jgi:hypothetical protein
MSEIIMLEQTRPNIEDFQRIGLERLSELEEVMVNPCPGEYLKQLKNFTWIKIEESRETPPTLSERGFGVVFFIFICIIRSLVDKRGPGIFGYINKLVLNFSPRFDARYFIQQRDIRISMGVCMLFNELENTFAWLSDIMLRGDAKVLPIMEVELLSAPPNVVEEVRRFRDAYKGLDVSGRKGFENPIWESLIKFILCHELGHMIYFAESKKLQQQWQETAWADYDDALPRYAEVYKLNRATVNKLSRSALPNDVVESWGLELIADGMGFYTASSVAPTVRIEPQAARQILQIAVEVFYHALVIAYHGETGSRTHPPPLLRAMVIAARQRQEYRMGWNEFATEAWGSGTITKILFEKLMNNMGRIHDA